MVWWRGVEVPLGRPPPIQLVTSGGGEIVGWNTRAHNELLLPPLTLLLVTVHNEKRNPRLLLWLSPPPEVFPPLPDPRRSIPPHPHSFTVHPHPQPIQTTWKPLVRYLKQFFLQSSWSCLSTSLVPKYYRWSTQQCQSCNTDAITIGI